ncbi:MAG: IS3 family transposase [Solobacterium sp.]|nr:IS3 family transposase [Solobacterium sp.]
MGKGLPKARRIAVKKANKEHIYQLIDEHKDWGIRWICELLGVSRAAYYKWKKRKPSERELANQRLLERIKAVAERNNSLFGKLAMTDHINHHLKEGESRVNHKRVYRIMCINNIRSSRPRYKRSTWHGSKPEQVAENILKRDFHADRPNEKWCTDITEKKIPGTAAKIYISTVIDLYDRYPVGIAVSKRNDVALVNQSLENAVRANPDAKPLFHSDRGFQYTRKVFKTMLEKLGMTQSMSRVSRCIDNGPMEGFQGILKDLIDVLFPDVSSYESMEEAIYSAFDYYINEYPQHRYKGKTAGEVRREALSAQTPVDYPIPKNNRIIKFWDHINSLKNQASTDTI